VALALTVFRKLTCTLHYDTIRYVMLHSIGYNSNTGSELY